MMLDGGAVLVWEWQDESSLWKPYSPQVAHYIEQVLRETPRANSVSLGEAEAKLTPYILDLISMNQFRLDTGALYPVRRVKFPLTSAPGRGIVWEWEELPGQWIPFETQLSILIQDAVERQQSGVCLGEPCNGSYICFLTMTQIEFPSQKTFRVRARAQIPYPMAGFKSTSNDFRPVLSQQLNRNINSKPGPFITHQSPMKSSHGIINFSQGPLNSHQGLVNIDQRFFNSNQKGIKNQGLIHINQGLSNSNQRLGNSNQPSLHSSQVPMNCIMRSGHEPLNSRYGLVDSTHMLGCINHDVMNANQILLDVNSGVVNFTTDPVHSSHRLVNSNDKLVNYNQDQDNVSIELINFNASAVSPEPSYSTTTARNSSPEPDNSNLILFEPSHSYNPQWPERKLERSMSNSSPALPRSNSRQAEPRPGLARSDSRYKDLRPDMVRSEARVIDCRPVLNRSNSRPEEYTAGFCRSNSRPGDDRPELLRSDSEEYRPEFVRSHSRPSYSKAELVRSDSRPGLSRSNSRQGELRPALVRCDSQNDDGRPTDCRSTGSRPEFIRSNSRRSELRQELVRSYSRSTDSKSGTASPHSGFSHSKPTLVGRGLSRSASLRGSRFLPSCTCAQCLLVQSVKSASWPGRESDIKPTRGRWHDSQRTDKDRGVTRVRPVPLSNLEGSGMIPPALAGISGLLMSAAGLPVCLSIPPSPIYCPPEVKKKDLRPVPGIQGSSRKLNNRKGKKPEAMVKQFLQRVKTPPPEDCHVCHQTLEEGVVGTLYRCSHSYHVRCLANLYKDGTLRCPTCQTLYGAKIGSQPPGKMSFHLIPHSLPGYPDCDTIRIIYYISPGVQGPGQPNPGMKFTAPDFPLHCYLPNTKKGREVLLLLIKAWELRLLFPLVPSQIPGVPDSVSISRIPHKTEFGSNVTGKGFPDSRYLDSVLRQLQDWGVSRDGAGGPKPSPKPA